MSKLTKSQMHYYVGDIVAIDNENNENNGKHYTVLKETEKNYSGENTTVISEQWMTERGTSYMNHSLRLVKRAEQVEAEKANVGLPFNLTEKQIAVLNAATELREAQIKFTKALDALNNNQ